MNRLPRSYEGAAVGIGCLIFFAFTGCAEIQPPSPAQILESPFGKSSLTMGMSKAQVRDLWGDPDQILLLEDGQYSSSREQWIYEARFPEFSSLDVGYASRTKKLTYDGQTLVAVEP